MIVSCSHCQANIYRIPHEVKSNISGLFFCNFVCRKAYTQLQNMVSCEVCQKLFRKAVAEQKRYPRHCCSIKCRSSLNDKRIDVACKTCGVLIKRSPSQLVDKDNAFCSKFCHDIHQTTRQVVLCDYCGCLFEKHQCLIKRSRMNFCSTQCSAKLVHKKSFIESEFETLVASLGIEYLRNDRTIVGPLELDFYFPAIKFAVEINGVWHYEPIHGEDVLAAQKARDKRKRRLCKELGITLRVVRPGNCKTGQYLPRFQKVISEINRSILAVPRKFDSPNT